MFKYCRSWRLACSKAGAQECPLSMEGPGPAAGGLLWMSCGTQDHLNRRFSRRLDVFVLPEGLPGEGLTTLKLAGSESRTWDRHEKAGGLHGSFGKLPRTK